MMTIKAIKETGEYHIMRRVVALHHDSERLVVTQTGDAISTFPEFFPTVEVVAVNPKDERLFDRYNCPADMLSP